MSFDAGTDRGPRRRTFLKGAAAGMFVAFLPEIAGRTAAVAQPISTRTVGRDVLRPVALTATNGDVTHARALLHGGAATLTYRAGGEAPLVVLDYGREVGGYPVFEIVRVTGTPELEAVYSEALPWLLPDGDGPAPGTPDTTAAAEKDISFVGVPGGADLSRVERLPLGLGRHDNRLMQGGQRFQALRLSAPGSVTLRVAGITPAFHVPGSAPRNAGAFSCSDPGLGETWQLGAYTLDVASVPAGAIRPTWGVSHTGVLVPGSQYSGYQGGVTWTDYTATFDVQVVANEASWLVRGQLYNGLRMVLCASDDALPISKPDTLRVYVQFTKQLLAEVALPAPLRAGTWHTLRTEVVGATARVFLDGSPVIALDFPPGFFFSALTAGWVGFGNAQGALARFRNLLVRDPSGNVLYRSALTDRAVLDDFATGTNTQACILDGAKRDRLLFTGDLGVANLNVLTSNYALEYSRDSIELFSAYQLPDGHILTSVPPQYRPGATPRGDTGAIAILDYTVHHVTTTYEYWFHTADRAFLIAQWPVVRRVMDYLAGVTQPSGLIATPSPFGGGAIPETLSNAHYVGALRAAAQLARAMGDTARAAAYQAKVPALIAAINRLLYNSDLGLYGTSTEDLTTVNEHANAYAVLYRVTPRRLVPGILHRLAATLETTYGPKQTTAPDAQVGPYTAGYDLLARFSVGDTAGALDIVRKSWGPMLRGKSDYPTGTAWEYVALDGTPGLGSGTSLCHPWSTMPTPALSKYVLGVRPLAPGYHRWLVEPQPGDLTHAAGRVPTPHGPIEVSWTKRGNRLNLRVSAPRGTTGVVGLPGENARPLVDGRAADPASTDDFEALDDYGYVAVTSGRHHILG